MSRSFCVMLAVLAATVSSQGPTLQSCSWRNAPLTVLNQMFTIAVVSCTFNEDLYITSGGSLKAITQVTGVVTTTTTQQTPSGTQTSTDTNARLQVVMGNTTKVCCGTKCIDAVGTQLFIGPPTTTPLVSFLGTLYKANVPSVATPRTISFFVVENPLSPFFQCSSSITVEYAPTSLAVCRGSASPQPACELKNSAGVAAGRNQVVTLGAATTGVCRPSHVDDTVKVMTNVLEKMVPSLSDLSQLLAIEFLMSAFGSSSSFVACGGFVKSVMSLKNVTKNIGTSRDCPWDYDTQRDQYNKEPCCAWFSTKCCVPKPVTRIFQVVNSINYPRVQSKCPAHVASALGNLILIAQDINERAVQTTFSFDEISKDITRLSAPLTKCAGEVFGFSAASCTKDGDCWTESCDLSNAANNNGQGSCQQSDTPYIPLIKCLLAPTGLRRDVAAQLLRLYRASGTTLREKVASAISFVNRTKSIQDCVGPRSYQYRAGFTYQQGADGNLQQVVVPANVTGCLAVQQCNFGWGLNQQQCLGSAALGTSPKYCARCYGRYCSEYSVFSECRIGGNDNATCVQAGGQWTQKKPSVYSSPNCQKRSAITLETCVDLALCPGSGSPWTYKGIEAWGCASPFCYTNASQQTCAGAGFGFYWNRQYRNGSGLCMSTSSRKTTCESGGHTWYVGTRFSAGRYDTQAKCTAPQCQLPNEYQLLQLDAASCRSKTSCSQSCPKCVSGYSYGGLVVPQEYCFVPLVAGISCPSTATEYIDYGAVLVTRLCYMTGLTQQECTAANGTLTTCGPLSEAQCGNWRVATHKQKAMKCRWGYNNKCTPSECALASKGECDDYYAKDYSCSYGADKATCGRCYIPYPKIMGTQITNTSCGANPQFGSNVGIGCGARIRSVLNYNQSACAAAGGTLRLPAKTQAACENIKACKRWGSSRVIMTQAQCTECRNDNQKAVWGKYYTWTKPSQIPGTPVSLKWKMRAYGPVNEVINTVPYYAVYTDVSNAIMKVIGRVYAAGLRKKYSAQLLAWVRLACDCIGSNPSSADTAVCARIRSAPVSVVTETCNCDANGECDQICPYSCPTACSYNVTKYLAAGYLNQNALRRRRLQAGYASYETVKNSGGQIIGQVVGNANKYAGVVVGTVYRLCLAIDSGIPQSPAYTIYDFAPGDGSVGAPGTPLGQNLTNNAGQICANVTAQNYPYWPIKRLPPGGSRAPTVSTTIRPSLSPIVSTTVRPTLNPIVVPVGGGATTTAPTTKNTPSGVGRASWSEVVGMFLAFFVCAHL